LFQARAALGSAAPATSAAFPSKAAYSLPNTLAQKTHSRVNLRLSEGTVSLSSVAQAFEQCLCPVIEILPKFRKGALCHFIYRAFTREIAANSDELNQGLNFSNFIRIQHRIWPNLPRKRGIKHACNPSVRRSCRM
jgi:hypothetical protein